MVCGPWLCGLHRYLMKFGYNSIQFPKSRAIQITNKRISELTVDNSVVVHQENGEKLEFEAGLEDAAGSQLGNSG